MNTYDTLGERIKYARGTNNQTEFSNTFGINQNTLSRYERNERIPDADFIKLICKTLGILPAWLLFGEGPMRPGEVAPEPQTPAEQPVIPTKTTEHCPRCERLEEKLEKVEQHRDKLMDENRQLWKENGDLRVMCARLEEQQKSYCEESTCNMTQTIPSNNARARV